MDYIGKQRWMILVISLSEITHFYQLNPDLTPGLLQTRLATGWLQWALYQGPMRGTSWHFCEVKENESTACSWNISVVPTTVNPPHAESLPQIPLNHTIPLTTTPLLTSYCSNTVVIWWCLQKCCHVVVIAVQRHASLLLSFSFIMTRPHFSSLFGCQYPSYSVLSCNRSTPSLSMLPTHGQVCVHMRRGGRGVLHAAYHNRMHWHDRNCQKIAQLNRFSLPLQK